MLINFFKISIRFEKFISIRKSNEELKMHTKTSLLAIVSQSLLQNLNILLLFIVFNTYLLNIYENYTK